MDYHHHAPLTVRGRELLCKEVVEWRLSLREASAERRLSRQSAARQRWTGVQIAAATGLSRPR